MRATLGILVLAVAPALADPAPRAPDFTTGGQTRDVDRTFAASSGDTRILPSDDVTFAFNDTTLTADDEATLGLGAHWLAVHPKAYLFVVAHADPVGTAAYNDDLSVRRGRAVRAYLASSGIASDRVVVVACGARGNATRRADLIAATDRDAPFPKCD
jgi:outer membrane protein OmpA-like peptidoglycan-associated protein